MAESVRGDPDIPKSVRTKMYHLFWGFFMKIHVFCYDRRRPNKHFFWKCIFRETGDPLKKVVHFCPVGEETKTFKMMVRIKTRFLQFLATCTIHVSAFRYFWKLRIFRFLTSIRRCVFMKNSGYASTKSVHHSNTACWELTRTSSLHNVFRENY